MPGEKFAGVIPTQPDTSETRWLIVSNIPVKLYMIPSISTPLNQSASCCRTLSKGGYDTVPCSSHCYGGDRGFVKLAEWCRDNMDPEHFIGYQMAPWMQTGEAYRRLLFRGSALLAEAKAIVGKE